MSQETSEIDIEHDIVSVDRTSARTDDNNQEQVNINNSKPEPHDGDNTSQKGSKTLFPKEIMKPNTPYNARDTTNTSGMDSNEAKTLDNDITDISESKKGEKDVVINISNEKPSSNTANGKNKYLWLFSKYQSQTTPVPVGTPLPEDQKRRKVFVFFQVSGPKHEDLPPEVGAPLEYSPDRNDFVRLVFTLVLIMLLTTAAFCVVAYQIPGLSGFIKSKEGLVVLVICLAIDFAMAYVFCSACSRVSPCNVINLVTTVVVNSYIVAWMTLRFQPDIVLAALLTTSGVVFLCLGLAYTSIDFTKCFIVVLVAMVACAISFLVGMAVCAIFNYPFKLVRMIIMSASTVVHSIMLIIELQMVLGGRTLELGENEWAYAAYILYNSIIDLFIRFLILLSDVFSLSDFF